MFFKLSTQSTHFTWTLELLVLEPATQVYVYNTDMVKCEQLRRLVFIFGDESWIPPCAGTLRQRLRTKDVSYQGAPYTHSTRTTGTCSHNFAVPRSILTSA